MKLNVDDAVRYMGAGKGNDEIREMTAAVAEELEKAIRPRYIWRAFHIEKQENGVLFREAGETLPGKLAGLLGQSGDENKRALLEALKPYLSETRRGKLDRAMKLTRMAKLARLAMGELGNGETL